MLLLEDFILATHIKASNLLLSQQKRKVTGKAGRPAGKSQRLHQADKAEDLGALQKPAR